MNLKKVSVCFSGLPLSLFIGLVCPLLPAQAETPIVLAQAQSYSVLYVNAQTGNNAGNGSETAPFRTITHALAQANPNTIVKLAQAPTLSRAAKFFRWK